jgi:virulence-associated protein VagC
LQDSPQAHGSKLIRLSWRHSGQIRLLKSISLEPKMSMTINIALQPDEEQALLERARMSERDLAGYIHQLLQGHLRTPTADSAETEGASGGVPSSEDLVAMMTAGIIRTDARRAVKFSVGFHFDGDMVSIRREGEVAILEPVKPASWPPEFSDRIRIDDPVFARPEQGQVTHAPSLD